MKKLLGDKKLQQCTFLWKPFRWIEGPQKSQGESPCQMLCENYSCWMFGDDGDDDDDDDDEEDDVVVVVVVVGVVVVVVPNFPELSYSNLPASNFTRSIPYNTLKSPKIQSKSPSKILGSLEDVHLFQGVSRSSSRCPVVKPPLLQLVEDRSNRPQCCHLDLGKHHNWTEVPCQKTVLIPDDPYEYDIQCSVYRYIYIIYILL